MWVVAGLLAVAAAFCLVLGPYLIREAYRGEGLELLTRAMGARDRIPLEEYLADWRALSGRSLAFGGCLLALAVVWSWRGWTLREHWLSPVPAGHLGLFRVLVVGMQLMLLLPVALSTCGGCLLDTQMRLAAAADVLYRPIPVLQVLWPPSLVGRPGAEFFRAVWWVAVASGALSLVGLFARVSLPVLAWAVTVLMAHSYSYGEFHHPMAVQTVALWVLAFSPAGRALSLDALRAGRGARRVRRWPLRTVQWVLAITYLDAALTKLLKGGLEWFNGYTLAYYIAQDTVGRGAELGMWLARQVDLLRPLSIASVGFELTFPLAVLLPGLAPLFVAGGVLFHLSIFVIHGPPFFQHMVLLPGAFVTELRDAWRRRGRRGAGETLAGEEGPGPGAAAERGADAPGQRRSGVAGERGSGTAPAGGPG